MNFDNKPMRLIRVFIFYFLLLFLGTTTASLAAPANDNLSSATLLSGSFGAFIGTNTLSTSETSETRVAGSGPTRSVWYKWVAPATGTVVMGTCNPTGNVNTNMDTMIGVFTGNTIATLASVTSNDDTTNCNSTVNVNYASTVSFNATVGTTYHIQVDGYNGGTGTFNFSYGQLGTNAGITVTTTDNSATEGGDTAAFTLALIAVPQSTVTLTLATSTFCTYSPTTLTFTTANWATPQTITATAVDDAIVEGTHSCSAAAIAASGGSYNTATASTPVLTIIDNDVAAFTIAKSVNQTNISARVTLSYQITVTNTGTIALTSPALTDTLAQGSALTLTTGPTLTSGDVAPLGTLNVGEAWVYTATYTVTQANLNKGASITNQASFSTTQTPLQNSNTAITSITTQPVLMIEKTPNTSGPMSSGGTVTYTYKVTNTGNVSIAGISINDIYNGSGTLNGPNTETLFLDIAPSGDSTDASINGTWDMLAPGDAITFKSSYVVTQHDVDFLQ